MSPEEQIKFWTQLYDLSPVLFTLVGFMAVVVYLWRKGLLDPTDPVEERWREGVNEELKATRKAVDQLYTKVAHIEGYIEGKKH